MKILESKGNVQEDLLFHTRILVLMSKTESGNDDEYDEFIKSSQKYIQKMKRPDDFHFESINFFKKLNDFHDKKAQEELYKNFDKKLQKFSENAYYRRSLLYMDIHGWVQSKVQNVDVIEIIKQKVKYKRK
jgi:hypothetical protein